MKNRFERLYNNDFNKVNDFLANNFSSPTHWQDWNIVLSELYNTDFFYFALLNEDKLVGVCPVHKIKNKLNYRLVSGPKKFYMPYGGWIFREKTNFNSESIKLEKNESLEIFSLPLIDEYNASYEGCSLLKQFETSLVDLQKTEDEIFDSFTPQKRYKIRKALRNDIEITSLEVFGLDNFYEFYVKTNARYGLENIKLDFFKELLQSQENIKINFFIAKKNNEVLGSVVLVSDKNFALYWLGNRIEKAPNIGYFDLLHWEMIKRAKSYGCKYYDTCYLEKERLPNIYRFKIGFSDTIIPVLNTIEKRMTYRILNKIQKII
jgi:lipid II:glycine glycyltransferase (peptidoglycan interpeptide bridge formation enzyme)